MNIIKKLGLLQFSSLEEEPCRGAIDLEGGNSGWLEVLSLRGRRRLDGNIGRLQTGDTFCYWDK